MIETNIFVGILKESGEFHYVKVPIYKRPKTIKLVDDCGVILGYKGQTVSFDNIESGQCFGSINDIVSISFEDNKDKVKADILGKLFTKQDNIQKRIKRVLENRGHVCNRHKDYLSKINKLIYSII